MKFASVVGARPQFVKLAPLSKKIRQLYEEIIIHTGQHYDNNMSKPFFEDLNIPKPNYYLGIGSGNHGYQTGKMLISIEEVFFSEKPNLVIVFGDTNSTIAGVLAAVKMHIPVVHIEAGLRSFNRTMPEEINRIATDHISDYLFAPTHTAMDNLCSEGLKEKAYLTGDIMLDSLIENIKKAQKSKICDDLNLINNNYILATLHRPYNVDNPTKLEKILYLFSKLDKIVVFPAHPRTKKIIKDKEISYGKNVRLIEPLGYLDFINLENNAKKIITDSGGIQKEAYILEKPCITIRPETEWVETVEDGWNILLDIDCEKFVEIIENFNPQNEQNNVFGKDVAKKMFHVIKELI